MEKIIDISDNCLKLITHFECGGQPEKFLKAAIDDKVGKVWTIGIGTIRYPDGTKVKEGDVITLDEANEYLRYDLKQAMLDVDALTVDTIEQHEFDALVSFVYNEGKNAYRTSNLARVINNNIHDYKNICAQFLRWKYDNHVFEPGLLRRRKAEAYLYVYGETKFYFTNNDNII